MKAPIITTAFFLTGLAAATLAALSTVVTISTPFPIVTSAAREMSAGGAFDGTNFLIGIQGYGTSGRSDAITAQLVSPAGALVGNRIVVVDRYGSVPAAAFDGTNYLMIWSDAGHFGGDIVYGQFISPNGPLVGSPFSIAAQGEGDSHDDVHHLAYGAGRYLLVFSKWDSEGNFGLYGQMRLPADRTPGGPVFPITGAGDIGGQFLQAVAFDGHNCFVVWMDGGQQLVKGQFISPAGVLIGEPLQIASFSTGPMLSAATVFNGTDYLIAWSTVIDDAPRVVGQRVTPGGALVGGQIAISSTQAVPLLPMLASDGNGILVTWTDLRNDTDWNFACEATEGTCLDVYGRFIDSTGSPAGPEFPLTAAGNQFVSPVMFGAGKYLVAWTDGDTPDGEYGDVYGAFVTGTPGDTTPPVVTAVSATPDRLWPPRNQMIPVRVAVVVTDDVDPTPACAIANVASSEPGSGQWQITGDLTLNLRASRNGAGTGRTYTVSVACSDASGNQSLARTSVTVPHDERK